MRKSSNIIFLGLMLWVDIIGIISSYLFAYWLRFYSGIITVKDVPPFGGYLQAIIFIVLIFLIIFKSFSLYDLRLLKSPLDEFYNIFLGVSFGTIINMAVTFIYRDFSYSRLVVAFAWGIGIFLLVVFRLVLRKFFSYLRARGYDITKVVIVGTDMMAQRVGEIIGAHPELGLYLVGYIENSPKITSSSLSADTASGEPLKILGNKDEIKSILEREKVELVIMALSAATQEEILNIILSCEDYPVRFSLVPDFFGIITSQVSLGELAGIPLINIKEIPLQGINRYVKRLMDITLASLGIIFLSPLFLICIVLIKYSKYSSPGPVFYIQERMGLDGRVFLIYKFRTMIVDAEKETGPVWAKAGDKRVTKLGSFLRKTSLDELPQLINVLKGEMSLIGPRPERPYFVDKFQNQIIRYMRRHRVKPGITGWAQVHGLRGDCSIEERTKYDLYYVENWSLLLDIKILIKTIFEVLFHKRAI